MSEDERFPPESEQALFRVTQEAINNVVKHAGAQRVFVTLAREGQSLVAEIADDGKGFSSDSPRDGSYGLAGMRERVLHLQGVFEVNSAPDSGTRVIARVPISGGVT